MSRDASCGNPIAKQIYGVTKLTRWDNSEKRPPSDNLGFCLSEGDSYGNLLIRVSAKGYKTVYYDAPGFRGCNWDGHFVLEKGR